MRTHWLIDHNGAILYDEKVDFWIDLDILPSMSDNIRLADFLSDDMLEYIDETSKACEDSLIDNIDFDARVMGKWLRKDGKGIYYEIWIDVEEKQMIFE
jgi:hypothetical protein